MKRQDWLFVGLAVMASMVVHFTLASKAREFKLSLPKLPPRCLVCQKDGEPSGFFVIGERGEEVFSYRPSWMEDENLPEGHSLLVTGSKDSPYLWVMCVGPAGPRSEQLLLARSYGQWWEIAGGPAGSPSGFYCKVEPETGKVSKSPWDGTTPFN